MKNLDKLIKLAKVFEQSKEYNLADKTINKIKITLAQETTTTTQPTNSLLTPDQRKTFNYYEQKIDDAMYEPDLNKRGNMLSVLKTYINQNSNDGKIRPIDKDQLLASLTNLEKQLQEDKKQLIQEKAESLEDFKTYLSIRIDTEGITPENSKQFDTRDLIQSYYQDYLSNNPESKSYQNELLNIANGFIKKYPGTITPENPYEPVWYTVKNKNFIGYRRNPKYKGDYFKKPHPNPGRYYQDNEGDTKFDPNAPEIK